MKKSDYSDVIKEFGYDLYGNNLIIEYNYGAKYIYKGVSKFEFDKFVYEKNKGKFLKEKIKNRCDYIKVK